MSVVVKQRQAHPARRSRALRAVFASVTAVFLSFGALSALPGCSSESVASGTDAGGAGSDSPTPGRFTPCEDDEECDRESGFDCVAGECRFPCESHRDCRTIGHCDTFDREGERRHYCVRDDQPQGEGEFYTRCPIGDECAPGFTCIGAGPGDLDAYCTADCAEDDECAQGFYCGTLVRGPCEDACGFRGDDQDPDCVPSDQIGEGKPYECGPLGLVRRVCRLRDFCSPCESDGDCLARPNQLCAKDETGEKICTQLCDERVGSCPWGNAAACSVFDEDVGAPTCSHRFGSCRGSGAPCEPCVTSDDCPRGFCINSSFTGERWCVDLSVECECSGEPASGTCRNGGCPASPGGLPMLCIDDEGSLLNGACYSANASDQPLGSSPQTGCWAAL